MPLVVAPSTWRVLGLSVAASYTAFGLFGVLLPRHAAFEFFGLPEPTASDEDIDHGAVPLLMPLLGARDLSIAAALYALAYGGRWREFGSVVVAGTILCAADCVVVWKKKGPRLGLSFCIGASMWTAIGAVLWSL